MKRVKKYLAIVLTVLIAFSFMSISSSAAGTVTPKDRYSVLVLDVSGSMYGSPIEELKKAAKAFCAEVFKREAAGTIGNNKIAIVTFEDSSKVVCDFTNDVDILNKAIDELYDMGSTNLAAGISSAKTLLSGVDDGAIKNILVMCDGYPNEGSPDGVTASYNEVVTTPLHWNIYGLYFYQDGYSDEAADVMKKVGRNGYFEVKDGSDLTFVFANDWSDIATEKTVNNVIIRIACPVDVSVELNGEVLDKNNRQTLFGTLDIEGVGDDEIKTVHLSYRDDYNIKIVGTGTGTMNYSISYRCNDEELYSLSYPVVNITPKTIITSKVTMDDKTITLDIDEDGDGKVDNSVSSNENDGNNNKPAKLSFCDKIKAYFKEVLNAIYDCIIVIMNIKKKYL